MQKEINKFLRKISAEKLKNNHKECTELYNIVGGLYSDIGSYDEAIHYHEKALESAKTIGDRLATALALRYIGEAKASLGNFYQAVDFIKKYLELAQKINDKVEIQRAWTTLGRVHLMQAQDMKDNNQNALNDSIQAVATEAEKKFQTALNLTDSIKDQVDAKEFAQMNSSLLVNLGLIKDICGYHGESVAKFNRAIEICKASKIKEDLYRCQILLASIYRKKYNIKMAVKIGEEALITAKQIGKKLLICDALIENGLIKICLRDFKAAKRAFAQAYLEKSPSEEDHAKAIRLTKLAHLITETFDKISKDSAPTETRLKLCDKLGDLFVAIEFYRLAIEFYKKALTDARICSKPKSEWARILFSIAETYADDGQFKNALLCYEKELELRNGNDNEQCQTLIKIAHMQEYLDNPVEQVSQAYDRALDKANKDPVLMHNVLKYFVPYLKKHGVNNSRLQNLEADLSRLQSFPEVLESIEKDGEEEINELEDEIANIDDVISEGEEDDEIMMIGRRRTRGSKKFKPNEVGETPLHEACIKGDLKRVKSLISQGHEVNPVDNAGWIPLHEACNHGHYDIVEFLIERGGDVNYRGLKGMSPLHDSATNGHFDIMRLLIGNGANVIALTDTGETVLSCLRDYKKRNYNSMSNSESSEYRQMESELLNIMDKRGFNLMEESIKNLGSTKSKNEVGTSHSSKEAFESQTKIKAKTSRLNVLNDRHEPTTNTIRDYKKTIGTLKRKRTVMEEEEDDTYEKPNLPATYNTNDNTSATTKEWLIDDVSRDKKKASSRIIFELEDSESSCDGVSAVNSSTKRQNVVDDYDNDDDDDSFMDTLKGNQINPTSEKTICQDSPTNESRNQTPIIDITNDSERCPSVISCALSSNRSNLNLDNLDSISQSKKFEFFDLIDHPLSITIDGRKLLIPVKGEEKTIKWLKEAIIDRYSALVNARPIISLAPVSDPTCLLYDEDYCKDVIKENLLAIIDSWDIDSILKNYQDNCLKFSLKPLDYIESELKMFDHAANSRGKLDLSYMILPKTHISIIIQALARRDFIDVSLMGSAFLFDQSNKLTNEIMTTISTWRKMKQLKFNCTALRRNQFEIICSKMNLPELRSLDLSCNLIVYKCKLEFAKAVNSLLEKCPKLQKIDLRKNDMQFVKIICRDQIDSKREIDLASVLDLKLVRENLQILADNQSDYSVYSA